jgi:hypothetical protein
VLHATPVRAEVVLGDGQVALAGERRRHLAQKGQDKAAIDAASSRELPWSRMELGRINAEGRYRLVGGQ